MHRNRKPQRSVVTREEMKATVQQAHGNAPSRSHTGLGDDMDDPLPLFPLISRIPIGTGQGNLFEASYAMPYANVVKSSKDVTSLFCS